VNIQQDKLDAKQNRNMLIVHLLLAIIIIDFTREAYSMS